MKKEKAKKTKISTGPAGNTKKQTTADPTGQKTNGPSIYIPRGGDRKENDAKKAKKGGGEARR